MKKFPVLYKYTQKGQIQQWEIQADKGSFGTTEGIKGGKLTISLPTVCTGKNIGKKNETTPEEQAELEAQAKWQKKVDSGYNEILSADKKFLEPMLAFEYSKYPINWKEVEMGRLRVYGQPKLDGLRCINENNTQMSRNGKSFLGTPHLNQDQVTLDGELYTHTYKDDFNKIVSLCKKQDPTEEELAEAAAKVEYWVYDFPYVIGSFSERHKIGASWVKDLQKQGLKLVLVPTIEFETYEDLEDFHAQNLEAGYEGTIIRLDNAPYEFKRSKQLLKFKDFQDDEFKIIGYEEGKGSRAGTIGKFFMDYSDGPGSKDFKSNVKGPHEYLREIWRDRDSYIGKSATVKFFRYTPLKEDGTGSVPKWPFITKINRESYE